jgi:hypothetical protein
MTVLGEAQVEIERLHQFLTDWFGGKLQQRAAVFETGLADHLHDDFEMVQPAGKVFGRMATLEMIRGGWGTNPAFRIAISNVRLLGDWPAAGLALAGYVEHQCGARNSLTENARRSTVLFERRDGHLKWRHLHETALGVA